MPPSLYLYKLTASRKKAPRVFFTFRGALRANWLDTVFFPDHGVPGKLEFKWGCAQSRSRRTWTSLWTAIHWLRTIWMGRHFQQPSCLGCLYQRHCKVNRWLSQLQVNTNYLVDGFRFRQYLNSGCTILQGQAILPPLLSNAIVTWIIQFHG